MFDLFCGCGGFSLGAKQAGFDVTLSVDIDLDLSSTYSKNFQNANIENLDLGRARASTLLSSAHRPDGIIGGPPCQGFSLIGKQLESDPRNSLVNRFFYYVQQIEPRFFLFENVPGALTPANRKRLDAALKKISSSYDVLEPSIVDAADFGAPTNRRRVFVAGILKSEDAKLTKDIFVSTAPDRNVADAIADLPSPRRANKNGYSWSKYPTNIKPSTYAEKMRQLPSAGLGWNQALEKLQEDRVSGTDATKHSKETIARFRKVKPGSTDPISRYPRLDWNSCSTTLRAGTGKDRGSYQAARPIHPDKNRVITVREAARIQGFPDWFTFHETKWHSFRMIGNSVSPIVAGGILAQIKNQLLIDKEVR